MGGGVGVARTEPLPEQGAARGARVHCVALTLTLTLSSAGVLPLPYPYPFSYP